MGPLRLYPFVLALAALPSPALADAPAAPGLGTHGGHTDANEALGAILSKLPAADRQKLTGVYVAFHPDARDPVTLAACDDDGDYVVVMSDAMLSIADFVAEAEAADARHPKRADAAPAARGALESYAALLAKEQRPGERLVPPPAGMFAVNMFGSTPRIESADRFRALVTHLIAAEVAHMVAGDVVCPSPTATHERADEVWTAQEHAAALTAAAKSHDARRVAVADAVATGYALDADANEEPMADFLATFVATVEGSPRARAAIGYARLHPGAALRAQIVRTAAAAWRAKHPTVRDGAAKP